jgi:hypothetical protein
MLLKMDESITQITTWDQFNQIIRPSNIKLLGKLQDFPNSILVTGCQRSGTTILTEIIAHSEGLSKFQITSDSELDAALILSGYINIKADGRYCFQTTYLNEKYYEYYEHLDGHRIIWLLRNPFSVVYSMLYNWGNKPDRLFNSCGVSHLKGIDKFRYKLLGLKGVSMLRRACWAYIGKTSQLFDLNEKYDHERLLVVDYDDLVNRKNVILPAIYKFIGLDYSLEYENKIHINSLSKINNLSKHYRRIINSLSYHTYEKARSLLSDLSIYE